MADVTGAGRRTADRGQLVLVTALSMAILFVTLALIVNTAIYTENLAMRSSDIGGGTDAVRYQDATRGSVAGTIEYVNYHNNSSADFGVMRTELQEGVDAYGNQSHRQLALSDRAVDVTLRATTNGTRIEQTNASRNFSAASGGTADWTLASDVDDTRAFRMHVSDDDLLTTLAPLSDRFHVEFDGTGDWLMYVYLDSSGSDIIVDVVNASGGGGTCTAAGVSSVWINTSAGTVGGTECEFLTVAEGVSGSYSIVYRNPDRVSGTYTLVVNNSTLAASPGPNLNSPGSGQPFATHAVYAARLDVTYQTPRLLYEATVRVAPEETT